jgi:hypothetical protein
MTSIFFPSLVHRDETNGYIIAVRDNVAELPERRRPITLQRVNCFDNGVAFVTTQAMPPSPIDSYFSQRPREIPCLELAACMFRLFVRAANPPRRNDIGLRIAHFLGFDTTGLHNSHEFFFTGRSRAAVSQAHWVFFEQAFRLTRAEQLSDEHAARTGAPPTVRAHKTFGDRERAKRTKRMVDAAAAARAAALESNMDYLREPVNSFELADNAFDISTCDDGGAVYTQSSAFFGV